MCVCVCVCVCVSLHAFCICTVNNVQRGPTHCPASAGTALTSFHTTQRLLERAHHSDNLENALYTSRVCRVDGYAAGRCGAAAGTIAFRWGRIRIRSFVVSSFRHDADGAS